MAMCAQILSIVLPSIIVLQHQVWLVSPPIAAFSMSHICISCHNLRVWYIYNSWPCSFLREEQNYCRTGVQIVWIFSNIFRMFASMSFIILLMKASFIHWTVFIIFWLFCFGMWLGCCHFRSSWIQP